MAHIGNALKELLDTGWKLDGIPTNETEFNEMFSIQTGTDEIDTAILSNNPDDFGITWAEVKAKADELESGYNAKQYARDREKAYPNIGDQLDMLWHAIATGSLDSSCDFYTTIKQVKDDNPKPE